MAFSFFIATLFTGCAKTSNVPAPASTVAPETTTVKVLDTAPISETAETQLGDVKCDNVYTVKCEHQIGAYPELQDFELPESYEYTIYYPEFTAEGSDDLNELVKSFALQTIVEYGVESDDDYYLASYIFRNFEVTYYDGKRVSIMFWGNCSDPRSVHPSGLAAAFNYDIENDKPILFDEIADIDYAFTEKALSSAKEQLIPEVYEYLEDDFGNSIDYIMADGIEYADYTFCFYDNSVGIVLPTIHAFGDHSFFRVAISGDDYSSAVPIVSTKLYNASDDAKMSSAFYSLVYQNRDNEAYFASALEDTGSCAAYRYERMEDVNGIPAYIFSFGTDSDTAQAAIKQK